MKRNLMVPFQRDRQRDFAAATGKALLRAKAMQALATAPGELAWRTNFGAGFEDLRHQRNTRALAELAKIRVREALRVWVPDAQLASLSVEQAENTLTIKLRVRAGEVEAGVEVGL